jgi:hypothetical protein
VALGVLAAGAIFGVGRAAFHKPKPPRRDPWGNAKRLFAVGKPAPVVVLPSLENGQPTSVADFRGKKVLLEVFASG